MRARRTQLTSLLSLGRDVDLGDWGGSLRNDNHRRRCTPVRFRATIAVSGRGSCARRRVAGRCGVETVDRPARSAPVGSAPSPAWSPVSAPDARGRPARTSSHTHRATPPPTTPRARTHATSRACVTLTVCIPIDYRNYGEYAVGNITRDSTYPSGLAPVRSIRLARLPEQRSVRARPPWLRVILIATAPRQI